MQIVANNPEPKLLELIRALRGDPGANYALHFKLSRLLEENRSDFQLKIAANVLYDIFRDEEGTIFQLRTGDIVVVYQGDDRIMLEKAIFQVRYLFVDDPLASNENGSENEEFSDLWDLGFQWQTFHRVCQEFVDFLGKRSAPNAAAQQGYQSPILQKTNEQKDAKNSAPRRQEGVAVAIDPMGLVEVMQRIEGVDISKAMRNQPICAKSSGQEIKPLFKENYVNIAHLSKLLGLNYNLLSDKDLFKYITHHLDFYVLQTIANRASYYLARPISLNLNVETVLSDYFMEFSKLIKTATKSVIIEINVADVFSDMYAFSLARELAQNMGYRICLDGLTNLSFTQVDRKSLGFDLAKLLWNADMKGDLGTKENQRLAEAIRNCGSNRMILCRCDSHHAIDYGNALGISLFQGRYADRMLNPDTKVVN